MSVLPPFELVRPTGLGEAIEAVANGGAPYAGGTELLLAMRAGLLRPPILVDLKTLPELNQVTFTDGRLHIGATATHRRVRATPEAARIPELAQVLGRVGNPRVRATGTLGGNLCFAEPKSDVSTLLVALRAEVELRSPAGERTMPLSEFLVGPYTTARAEDELLTSISVPVEPGRRAAYGKFQTMERPTVGIAVVYEPDGTRRIVIGAVGPVPTAFEFSSGEDVDPGDLVSELEVIPDLTGGEAYKRHVTRHLLASTVARLGEVA